MQFKNPANGHIETRTTPGLWAFLFGGFYFLIGGHWPHFVVWLLIAIGSVAVHPGLAFLMLLAMAIVYASLAEGIVRNAYLRRGWVEVRGTAQGGTPTAAPVIMDFRKCPYCAEDIRAEAVKCKHCGSEVVPIPPAPSVAPPVAKVVENDRFANLMAMHGVTEGGAGYVWNGRSYSTPEAVEDAILSRDQVGNH